MRIKQHFILDLAKGSSKPMAIAVQGEANTRVLVVSLFDKGAEWKIPNGTTAAVAFRKPDGKSGLYDTLPDGSPATVIDGNTVEATLAAQALTTSGRVSVAIVFYDANLNTLATFPFWIIVEANPAAGEQISNDYYKYSTLEQLNKAIAALEMGVTPGPGSGGNAQADWNAAEEQPGHILNRPFYSVFGEVLFPETKVDVTSNKIFQKSIGLEIGETYIVTIDGIAQEVVADSYKLTIDGVTHNQPILTPSNPVGKGFIYIIDDNIDGFTHIDSMGDHNGEITISVALKERVVKIPEKYLPDSHGSGGNADWNAGEGEPGHVLNRTHWVEQNGETETIHKLPGKFLPDGVPYVEYGHGEIPITGEWMQDDDGFLFASTAPLDLEIGETYTVKWNGDNYDIVAADVSELMGGIPATGLMGDGIPFEFVSLGAEAAETMGGIYVMAYGLDGAVATFTIYGRATIAHTIDPRCLPDNELVVNVDISTHPNVTADKNSNEIYAAVKNGKNVTIYMNGVILPCIYSEPNGAFFIMPSAQYKGDEIIGVSGVSAWCIKPDGSVLVS